MAEKIEDFNKYPPHMRGDIQTRNENIARALPLCAKCDGTGNELYSMYRACEDCGGSGRARADEAGR